MTNRNARRAEAHADHTPHLYSDEVLAQMQSLLAGLADVDTAYESDLETVRNSNTPLVLKQEVIRTLEQRHQQRRAPYVRQLDALQRRVSASA